MLRVKSLPDWPLRQSQEINHMVSPARPPHLTAGESTNHNAGKIILGGHADVIVRVQAPRWLANGNSFTVFPFFFGKKQDSVPVFWFLLQFYFLFFFIGPFACTQIHTSFSSSYISAVIKSCSRRLLAKQKSNHKWPVTCLGVQETWHDLGHGDWPIRATYSKHLVKAEENLTK